MSLHSIVAHTGKFHFVWTKPYDISRRWSRTRDVETSFSKTTGNKTLEFDGVSPSNDLTRYKMESFYFYLISMKCADLRFCAPDDHPHSIL
jgi:hypothetical protein